MLKRFIHCAVAALTFGLLSACAVFEPVSDWFGAPGDYSIDYPHGQISDLLLNGDFVLLGSGWSRGTGVFAFDISDPKNPKYAGGVPAAGYITARHAVYGNYAYYPTTFSIMVIKLPEKSGDQMELMENIMIGFPENGFSQVKVSGRTLYALSQDGIRSWSLSSPWRPVLNGFYPKAAGTNIFAAAGGKLYWRDSADAKKLVCSDDKKITLPEPLKGLYESDGVLYLLVGNGKLTNLKGDVIVPRAERLTDERGTLCFFTAKKGEPTRFHRWKGGKTITSELPSEFGGRAIVADDTRFAVMDVGHNLLLGRQANPDAADLTVKKLSKTPIIFSEGPLAIYGKYVVGISPQGSGYLLYGYRYDRDPKGKTYDWHFAYSSDRKNTFNYEIMTSPAALLTAGRWLFAPDALIDLDDVDAPRIVARTGMAASKIKRQGDRVYLAQGREASIYRIFRERDRIPEKIGSFRPSKMKEILDLEPGDGGLIYAYGGTSVEVFDASDPDDVKFVSSLDLPDKSLVFMRFGDYLYLLPGAYSKTQTLRIVNASNPNKLFVEKEIPNFLTGKSWEAIRHGNTFLTGDGAFLRQFDVSVPLEPKLIRSFSGKDMGMQGYNFIGIAGKDLIGKKYPRYDVWRDFERADRKGDR